LIQSFICKVVSRKIIWLIPVLLENSPSKLLRFRHLTGRSQTFLLCLYTHGLSAIISDECNLHIFRILITSTSAHVSSLVLLIWGSEKRRSQGTIQALLNGQWWRLVATLFCSPPMCGVVPEINSNFSLHYEHFSCMLGTMKNMVIFLECHLLYVIFSPMWLPVMGAVRIRKVFVIHKQKRGSFLLPVHPNVLLIPSYPQKPLLANSHLNSI